MNVKNKRTCNVCKGTGQTLQLTLENKTMWVNCRACKGKRYIVETIDA